jgi:hypothetical protein
MAICGRNAGVQDLYIVDGEYLSMGGKLESHRNFLSEVVEDYLKITEYLCAHNEGQYIEKLSGYRRKFADIPTKVIDVGACWKQDCEQYIEKVDEADEFLYEK